MGLRADLVSSVSTTSHLTDVMQELLIMTTPKQNREPKESNVLMCTFQLQEQVFPWNLFHSAEEQLHQGGVV